MIVDFHTHTFQDTLAGSAVHKLAKSAKARNYLDGTTASLLASMQEAGVDYSVLLPVVTRPSQQTHVNQNASVIHDLYRTKGLVSFGGIHPDNENYASILRSLAARGIPGIKLHPVYQQTPVDDIRFLRIISCACEQDLVVLIHAGYDISMPGQDYASVSRLVSMLDTLHPGKMVLAHMGGWGCWEIAERELVGRDIWLDTSFCLLPICPMVPDRPHPGSLPEHPLLDRERFLRMVRSHGPERILFGTDSPWSSQQASIACLRTSGLTQAELAAILGANAASLLGLLPQASSGPKVS